MQTAECNGLSFVVIWQRESRENVETARRVKESIKSNGYFRRKSYRSIGALSGLVATVRVWSATRPNRLRGVLTLFAPTRPVVARRGLSLTLTTRQ